VHQPRPEPNRGIQAYPGVAGRTDCRGRRGPDESEIRPTCQVNASGARPGIGKSAGKRGGGALPAFGSHYFRYCLAPFSSCKIQRRARRMAESFEGFITASCWRTDGDE
jgi:hypothetical protein